MSVEKRQVLLTFVLTTLAGSALHFLYTFFPSPLTALISNVNESIWEHSKLLFWPGLVGALVLARKQGALGARLGGLLVGFLTLLALGYLYCVTLGGRSAFLNIGIYILCMALVTWLPGPLEKWLQGRWTEWFVLPAAALGCALLLFTFLPPQNVLFADLSAVRTWLVIPV